MMESIYESVNTRNALVFAAKAHEGQFRKYTNEPYITHTMAVAEMLLEHGVEDPEMHAAALLHDVVEDTTYTSEDIEKMFGEKPIYTTGWKRGNKVFKNKILSIESPCNIKDSKGKKLQNVNTIDDLFTDFY